MSCADRSECVSGNHSSDHACVNHGHDGGHKSGYDEHDRSNARECQQSRSAMCAHPRTVAARQVQPAKRVVLVDVRRAHDARSTAFRFSRLPSGYFHFTYLSNDPPEPLHSSNRLANPYGNH